MRTNIAELRGKLLKLTRVLHRLYRTDLNCAELDGFAETFAFNE